MKILFIGMNFYDYEERIIEHLNLMGHEVVRICDSIPKYTFYKRIFGSKAANRLNFYHQKALTKSIPNDIDIVFVIVGRFLYPEFLKSIKMRSPNARFILYLWDDVGRVNNFDGIKCFFNDIYSFDHIDCRKYGFKFLPLFYYNNAKFDGPINYDIYSLMYNHSDRISIANKILEGAKKNQKRCRFIIDIGKFPMLIRKLSLKNNAKINKEIELIGMPISAEENYKNMRESKAILDIQYDSQNGLTMRTIECLGMKKKIITTNKNIKEYDFYDEQNIQVVDRKNPQINWSLLDEDYVDIPSDIYNKYSLDSWLDVIVNNKREVYLRVSKL